MGKAPYGFVRSGTGRYWSRERVEQTLKECRNEEEVRQRIPTKVTAGFLEQDFRKGRGKNDSELCREKFKIMPDEAIRKAMGQPGPDEPHRRPHDED